MKLLRVLFFVLCLIIVVIGLIILCLIYFIDPNKLKPIIIKEVQAQTGYVLTIDDSIGWSFYPRVGIKIKHMTMNVPSKPTFIDLKNVSVATDFWPLMHGVQTMQGDLHISDARIMNLKLTNVKVDIYWKNKILQLKSIQADLYDGTLKANVRGLQLSGLPVWNVDAQFNNIELKPLLVDLNGADSKLKISGLGQMHIQISAQGRTREQVINSLMGDMQTSVNNGIVEGLDLNYFIRTADQLINKEDVAPPENIGQTAFDSLTSTMAITNGVANTNNLLLVSSAFMAKGQGSVALNSQTINLQLQVKSQEAIKTQWEIPILITGDITSPSIRLDMSALQKYLTEQEIDQLKEKARDQIQKHIPGKAGEFLNKLLQ